MMHQRVHHALVQFRPNPADASKSLLLAILVGFQTEKSWAVGMAVRGSLPRSLVAELDPLSQAMLESRSELIKTQMQDQFESCSNPEEVLQAVSRENFTSFFVTDVQTNMLDLFVEVDKASLDKIAEDYVMTIFRKDRQAADERRLHSISPLSELEPINTLPPWMTGTQVWWRPNC